MPANQEKRFNRRTGTTAPIIYFPFSSHSSRKCEGTVLNSNERGLCFQSQRPLKPGQCICIHTTRFVKGTCGLRNLSLAQVRWCEQNEERGWVNYNIGVSYC
jgi:hypothetical protein